MRSVSSPRHAGNPPRGRVWWPEALPGEASLALADSGMLRGARADVSVCSGSRVRSSAPAELQPARSLSVVLLLPFARGSGLVCWYCLLRTRRAVLWRGQ